MNLTAIILLAASITLSTGRNLLSKQISCIAAKTKGFYQLQAILFLSGAGALLTTIEISSVSALTIVMAVSYALLLLSAQWNYTTALQRGEVGLCSTVYSLGFVLPTLSGALFWNEPLSAAKAIGIVLALWAVAASRNKTEAQTKSEGYFIPLLLAMLSSGGLGLMQKIQQSSATANEKGAFIVFSFVLAGILSLLKSRCSTNAESALLIKHNFLAALVGICFGLCNYFNTVLAGLLESAVLFPVLNIGTILLSLTIGVIAFKEPLTRRKLMILALGVSAILLISR